MRLLRSIISTEIGADGAGDDTQAMAGENFAQKILAAEVTELVHSCECDVRFCSNVDANWMIIMIS